MKNLNTINAAITQAYIKIQQDSVEAPSKYMNVERECAYLTARGKERIYLNELAQSLTGMLIKRIDNVVPEQTITVYPEKSASNQQSLNASLKMVVLHGLLLSGYTEHKGIKKALENWITQDSIEIELDTEQVAHDLLANLLKNNLIYAEEGQAKMDGGGYFKAYGITDEINDLRWNTINRLWDKAQPRMQPMRHPVRWLHDGTCQLNNLKLVGGRSEFNQDFVESFNLMGHVAYVVNEEIQDEINLWLEAHEDDIPETDDLEPAAALRVVQQHQDKVKIMNELVLLPLNTPLYFPHTADWRGRAYSRGGLTQFQSIKECRAMFDFYKPSVVTDPTGLYLHVANAHDMDKISINERLKWVKDNSLNIQAGKLSKGIYAKRAAIALREYNETGQTNVICHIDGTCNGTQWTSAMYRDDKTAKLVNVMAATHDDIPHDLYGVIADYASKLCGGAEKQALLDYNRDLAKPIVMVLGYGAGEETLLRTVTEYLQDHGNKTANPKLLTQALVNAIALRAPALTKLTKNLKRVLKRSPRHELTWYAPDMKVKTLCVNTEHLNLHGTKYTAKLTGRSLPDADALARGISPNYVHSMDSAHLRAVTRKANCDLSNIHDSIGAPANEVIRVNKVIREEFHRLNQVDIVGNIYSALDAKYKAQNGNLNIDEVLEASYIFS